MKTRVALALTAFAAFVLASCGEQKPAEAPKTNGTTAQMPMGNGTMKDGTMSGDMRSTTKTAKSLGTVTAIDQKNGTITLDHQAIPEAGWPAMTMAFKAGDPQMLDQVKVGQRVAFELKLEGGAGQIIAIAPQ